MFIEIFIRQDIFIVLTSHLTTICAIVYCFKVFTLHLLFHLQQVKENLISTSRKITFSSHIPTIFESFGVIHPFVSTRQHHLLFVLLSTTWYQVHEILSHTLSRNRSPGIIQLMEYNTGGNFNCSCTPWGKINAQAYRLWLLV